MRKTNLEKPEISFVPVDAKNAHTYITVGIQSYTEHYLHLWENSDPTPFIREFLTIEVLLKELKRPDSFFYIIYNASQEVGILNFTLDKVNPYFPDTETLLLNKLYLIRSAANKGIGSTSLEFTETFARTYAKQVVWLYTMKKGKPKEFYRANGYKTIAEAEITLARVLKEEKAMWVMAKVL